MKILKNLLQHKQGFVSLIGLFLILGLIFFLVIKTMEGYVKKPVVDKKEKKILMSQGETLGVGYNSALSRIKSQVDDINKKTLEREKELNNL